MKVEIGSVWWGGEDNKFIVLAVVEQEGHTWVHYRDDKSSGINREYSCYIESFLQRFIELPK